MEKRITIKNIALFIFLSSSLISCLGQYSFHENLKKSSWLFKSEVTDLNLGVFEEIGLSKLRISLGSLKGEELISVWKFFDDEIVIQSFNPNKGKNQASEVKVKYTYDPNNREIKIFHWIHDSTCWTYSATPTSTGSYVLLMRKY